MTTVPEEVQRYGIAQTDQSQTPSTVRVTLRLLISMVASLELKLEAQAKEIAELKERLRLNSQNSSKPPSSDGPGDKGGKRRNRGTSRRKRGGQKGRRGSGRRLVPVEDVDAVIPCPPKERCDCGREVSVDFGAAERHQVFELPKVKPDVTEYQILRGVCVGCARVHHGELPAGAAQGLLGPRTMAIVAILSGKFHLSKRKIQGLLGDLFGLDVGLGTVSNTERRVSDALEGPVEEAKAYVRQQSVVHMDETGHRVCGKAGWMWVAVTSLVTVFAIRMSRGAKVAKEILGEGIKSFKGILVSDRYSAYNWYATYRRQVCWAHLIRDLTKISERDGQAGMIGHWLLGYAQKMFSLWHRLEDGRVQWNQFQYAMLPIQAGVESLLEQGTRCDQPQTRRTCKQILKVKTALWTFVRRRDVHPTNNVAERAIRPYVVWRKCSYGTQSEQGSEFVERILTVSATCAQQNRSVLAYVTQAMQSKLERGVAPSLLPDSVDRYAFADAA